MQPSSGAKPSGISIGTPWTLAPRLTLDRLTISVAGSSTVETRVSASIA